MAIVRAVKSGNWSDTTVWNTGALPTSADDVYSNTFTVTIDISPTVLSISNAATTGVTAGGGFTMSAGGYTLTANVNASGAVDCLTVSVGSGATATVVGNIQAGSTGRGIVLSGAGTLNITGNCTGGSSTNGQGVSVTSSGTCNITGSCTGGSGVGSFGANNNSTGSLNITGTCTGGSGGAQPSGPQAGINNTSTGTLTHAGAAQASAVAPGIGVGSIGQITILSGPLLASTTVHGTAAASGVSPCMAYRWFPADTALSTFQYQMRGQNVSGLTRPARDFYLSAAYDALYPTAANVRSGTLYGPANIYTGTCAVPPAGSVALGVPVDNTTGSAYITASDITTAVTTSLSTPSAIAGISSALTAASAATFNQPITSLTTPNSIGERLKNSATVATVSQQISDVFSSRQ